MKKNLTEALVRNLEAPQTGRLTIRDARTPGLLVVLTAHDTKSFYWYGRAGGKPRRVLLGHWPTLTVDAARKLARETGVNVANGADPTAEKRQRNRGGLTLGAAFDTYIANRIDPKGSTRTKVTVESRFETCLGHWRNRQLDAIRRDECVALHVRLGKDRGHTTANRAIQLLRVLYNFAARDLGAEITNPASRVEMFAEPPRERFLRAHELPKLFAAIEAEPDPTFRDFFQLALFTGARRGNVQSMRWDAVDLDAATWVIDSREFKTRRRVTVVLADEAVAILKRRAINRTSEFVFPSHGKAGHLVEPKTAWKRIVERAGLKDLRIHDLRRTLGSWQAAAGASLPVIGKSLGHADQATTQIYARLDLSDVRQSVAVAARAIAEAAAKVTPQADEAK